MLLAAISEMLPMVLGRLSIRDGRYSSEGGINAMFRMLLFASTFLLLSCVNVEEINKRLGSWVGSTEDSLIAAWGPPNRSHETDNSRYLTWSDSGQVTIPGTPPSYTSTVIGNTIYTNPTGGTSPTTVNFRCNITMTVSKSTGRVTSWRWEGNNC